MTTSQKENAASYAAEHRTVSRVMAILEVVVASDTIGVRLPDLSEAINAPKSSVHGLAKGLVATGYLREEQGRYLQGPAISTLLATGGQPISASYHHVLEQLSRKWNETAVLATLVGDSVINVDAVEPNQMIRASPPLHERRPLWPGSYGKCFLAYMDPRRRDSYLRRKHVDADERARVLDELATVRATGIAFNRGETIPELIGVASPIVINGSEVTMAIGLAGPAPRMADKLDEIAQAVHEAARGLENPGTTQG